MVDERSWREDIKLVGILCEENIIDKCRWVIGLTVMYEYALVCSLFFCIDGKKFDDLVPFSDCHCIFSPFSELDFWPVQVGNKLVSSH